MVENNNCQVQADIRVRPALIEDSDVIVEFACKLALDTENYILDRPLVKSGIDNCIQDPKIGYYCLAWDENDPEKKSLGYIMVTPTFDFALGGLVHWIGSVYVLAEARKKGVFRALYSHVKEIACMDP